MPRMRMIFVSLLAALVASSIAVSAASGAVQGPWWLKLSGGKQVKIEPAGHLQVKSQNEGAFILKSKAILMNVTIECRKVADKGFIWNGQHQGQDESAVKFTECFMTSPCKNYPVTVGETKVVTELMWKYRGIPKELEEAGGGQKIYDVFAPSEGPVEEFAKGKFGVKFTIIEVAAEVEGVKCPVNGKFPVYAAGSKSKWEDQKGTLHEVIWGTAALVEPQNADAKIGHLKWQLPNVKLLHHQGVAQEAALFFGVEPAELEGTIKVEEELGLGTEFGAWDKV